MELREKIARWRRAGVRDYHGQPLSVGDTITGWYDDVEYAGTVTEIARPHQRGALYRNIRVLRADGTEHATFSHAVIVTRTVTELLAGFEPFGFELITPGAGDEESPADYWTVRLPHQCGSWVIAGDPDRLKVLAEVRQFRAELDRVIAGLEEI